MANKCKVGFQRRGDRCIKIVKRVGRSLIEPRNRNIRFVIIGLSIILAFLFVIIPDVRVAVGINLIFLGIAFFIYSTREFQDDLIGIPKFISMGSLIAVGWGILFTGGFYLITLFLPFFSLAFPRLPASIGSSLEFFMIVITSPISESILFIGAIFAFFRNFNSRFKFVWITLVSLLFAFFHLGSFIAGFYILSGAEGLTAFTSNISAFITAFVFNFVTMAFLLRKKDITKADMIFAFVFHLGLNLLAFSLSVISFVMFMALI